MAHELAQKLGGELAELFLPRDFGEFCAGCRACFNQAEKKCPHHSKLKPITQAPNAADAIVLVSPVHVYATGP